MFTASIYVPGTPGIITAEFDTAAAAWWHLYHARCDAERFAPLCDQCENTMSHGPMGDCDDDSETAGEMSKRARLATSGLVCDFETAGGVVGPTPGYRGDDDPGVEYSVIENVPAAFAALLDSPELAEMLTDDNG